MYTKRYHQELGDWRGAVLVPDMRWRLNRIHEASVTTEWTLFQGNRPFLQATSSIRAFFRRPLKLRKFLRVPSQRNRSIRERLRNDSSKSEGDSSSHVRGKTESRHYLDELSMIPKGCT